MRMNYFKLKFLLLFFALAVAIPPAWAGEESVTFLEQGYTDQQEITSYEGTNFSISFDKGTNKYAPKYFNSGTAIRVYGGNTMTVTSEKVITKIELSFATGGNSNAITTDVETYSDGTWTGSSNSVKFTVGGTTGHRRISSVKVTYTEGGDTPPAEENIYQKVTNASQLVAGKTYIIVNESANVGMGAVDDNRYGTVVTGLEFADGKVNIGGTEVTELTLGGNEKAWTFMLPNSQYLAKGNNDNKFLLATSPTTNISKWTIDLSNGCSIINNDNSDESYRYIRYENNNNRFDISNYSNVALYVKYEGGDTPQPADVTLSFPENSYTATLGQTFNAPTLSVDPADAASEVTYSSSNTGVAMVDEETGAITLVAAGTTTITAEISGSDTYNNATASYTLTVEKAPEPSGNEYVLVKDIADLATGKHIIFVNKDNAKAMSSTQSGNNRPATDITISESNVATATEATEIFTLEQTQVEDVYYWLFKASKTPGYIYAAGANSNNYLKTEEKADNRAQATVTIASDGEATVVFNAGTRNTLKYNSSNDIFSCYASGQLPVYIFIEKSGDTPQPTQVATPTFKPAQGEYTEAQNVTITCATEDAVIHYTVDGTDPTAESPVYDEAIAVGETMTIKAIAMKEGMTNSEIATATYTINIPSGEGKTFVKVTAADQLVAGKKYIIVCGNKALGVALSGNFLSAIDVTSGNEVTVSDNGVAIMTLGGTLGHYTLALGDNYLHAANSTSLGFGTVTEWAITDFNGTLDGYRVKHAEYDRAVRYSSGYNRFGNYATSDNASDYGWIYVEKTTTPQPEPLAISLTPAPEQAYTVGDKVTVTATVENGTENTVVTYKIGEGDDWQNYPEGGIVLPNTAAGDVVVTVKATDGTNKATDEVTYHFNAAKAFEITLTATPAQETYKVNDVVNVKVAVANTLVENPTITYTIGETREAATYDPESGINVTSATAGTVKLTVNVTDGYEHVGENTATADYIFVKKGATLSFGETTSFTVYPDADFTAPTPTGVPEGATVTYSSDNEDVAVVDENTGEVVIGSKTGTATITATFAGNDEYSSATATYTITVEPRPIVVADKGVEFELYVGQTGTETFTVMAENLKGDITLTLNDETGFYSIEPTTIDMDDAENATVTVTYAPTTEGFHEATVTLSTKDAEEDVTVTLTGMAEVQPVVAAPTFSLVAGSYGKAQQLIISAESGATILYSTDGSEPTTKYTNAIDLGQGTTTVKAVATKDGSAKSPVVQRHVCQHRWPQDAELHRRSRRQGRYRHLAGDQRQGPGTVDPLTGCRPAGLCQPRYALRAQDGRYRCEQDQPDGRHRGRHRRWQRPGREWPEGDHGEV